MKYKTILILIFGIFLYNTTNAQSVNYGIKGGLTLSNLYIDQDELDDENSRFGINGGLYSQFLIDDIFGLQPEFLFTSKGAIGKYSGIINETVEFKMNYIDIPVLLVIKPIDVIEFHVGPYFGILLNSNVNYNGIIDGYDEIDRDNFNSIDYGMAGGVALNFGAIQAGVRYNLGFQKLADSDVSDFLLGESKNSYGQIYIAIKIQQ